MSTLEQISFELISRAGMAKSNFHFAIQKAREQLVDEAAQLMEEGNQILIEAHQFHSELIKQEASGDPVMMTLILTHAEDIMMSAENAKDLAGYLIDLFTNYNLVRKD